MPKRLWSGKEVSMGVQGQPGVMVLYVFVRGVRA